MEPWLISLNKHTYSLCGIQIFACYMLMIDCLIVGCLTSSGKYFMHIQDENKFNNYKIYRKWGWGGTQQANGF